MGAAAGIVVASTIAGGQAPDNSVRATFEKYNLIGIFATDCGKAASKDNPYFVNRVLDDGHVQRDQMDGPTLRDAFTIIDQIRATSSDEVSVSGKRDDGQASEIVWKFEGNRVLGLDATIGGKKVIAGGKWVGNGQNVPWLTKCGG